MNEGCISLKIHTVIMDLTDASELQIGFCIGIAS